MNLERLSNSASDNLLILNYATIINGEDVANENLKYCEFSGLSFDQ